MSLLKKWFFRKKVKMKELCLEEPVDTMFNTDFLKNKFMVAHLIKVDASNKQAQPIQSSEKIDSNDELERIKFFKQISGNVDNYFVPFDQGMRDW